MKKLIKNLLIGYLLFIPALVKAAGGLGVSPSSADLQVGTTGGITVCMNNAAGRVDFSASGPISISSKSEFIDSGCITLNVTAKSNGKGVVTIKVVDGTTYDDEDVTGQSTKVTINVYTPTPVTPPVTPPIVTPPSNPSVPETLSGDTSLASVSVSSYDVTKKKNTYYATVPSDVESIILSANTNEFKTTVTGTGVKTLAPGDNEFTLKVTAPNGSIATYKVIVTRKSDYFKLDYLDEALSLDTDIINIRLDSKDILTIDILDKIKNSNKNVNLFVYDDDNNLLYEWIFDTKTLDYEEDFNPILKLNLENQEDILAKINYVESIIFEVQSKIPTGVKLRFNTSIKYKADDVLASYKFVNNEATLNGSNKEKPKEFSKTSTGFYEMVPDDKGIYIISKGNLLKTDTPILSKIKTVTDKKFVWVSIAEGTIILGLIGFIMYKTLKNKNKLAPAEGEIKTVKNDKKENRKLLKKKPEKIEFMVPGVVPPEPASKEEPKEEVTEEKEIEQVIVAPEVSKEDLEKAKEEEKEKAEAEKEAVDIDDPVESEDMPKLDIPLVIVPPKVPTDEDVKEAIDESEVSDVIVADPVAGEEINSIELDTLDKDEKEEPKEDKKEEK